MPEALTLAPSLVGCPSRTTPRNPRLWARAVWFGTAIALNALIAAVAARQGGVVEHATEASLAALCIAVAARHDGIVRGAFLVGRSVRSYRLHLLIDHLGQLHRAMAMAGTVWFAVAIATAGTGDLRRAAGAVVLAILAAMAWTARDAVRGERHNRFEVIHRYGGWSTLAILAVLVHGTVAIVLFVALIALVVHPWLGVRRVPVELLTVTGQVIVVALPGRCKAGQFARVSREGREWHSFAVATTGAEGDGRYCLVIRRAGDWTERLAHDAECGRAPRHLYVRRLRGHGFMHHAQAYRRVLIVATGAGIGPVLPYLLGRPSVSARCLWIARDHCASVGEDLVGRAARGGALTLVDTANGRPDVAGYVAELAPRFEAVFVVSNAAVRDQVARACEELDVPCYGPTFDS